VAKLSPSDLAQVLSRLPPQPSNENVLVGYELADDAGVFRLNEYVALVQTVDFFTPIADDPYIYGQVAAINSLNDIYAMGALPITALSIVCYPQKEDMTVLGEILRGGQATMNEANVIILGGHSIDDVEIKIGYSVTGIIDPSKIITNAQAKPGDSLILTKPIGTGAISTGIKKGLASERAVEASIRVMTTSAAFASREMQKAGANACTDITGFGLLGHAFEMARASEVSFVIESSRVPLLPNVLDLIAQGMLTRGDKNNRVYVGDTVRIENYISREMQSALFDPQTAGGLLISIDSSKAEGLVKRIDGAVIIGSVQAKTDYLIHVI
jgi:selenide, water dikinase